MRGIGSVMGIIMIMVAFIMFPLILDATGDVLTDEGQESGNLTTAVGVTTATIVLSPGLYNDDVDYVETLTSTNVNDVPEASSYNSTTDTLTISGLEANTWRTMTVDYDYGATGDYTGLGALGRLAPTIIFLALIATGIGMVYTSWRGRGS